MICLLRLPVRLALVAAGLLAVSGCLSTKYRMAPKETPPPPAYDVRATQPPVTLALQTVIVFHGPGSWKKEAYWDEYGCTLANTGPGVVVIESAAVTDALGVAQPAGNDPWKTERASRANIKRFEKFGRKILLGAGALVVWTASAGVVAAAPWLGSAGIVTVAGAAFFAIPIWAISSGVRTLVAKDAIMKEFDRRRLPLPLTLDPGESRQGSFFFPISPGPQRLTLRCRVDGAPHQLVMDLAPLKGLHLQPSEVTSGK